MKLNALNYKTEIDGDFGTFECVKVDATGINTDELCDLLTRLRDSKFVEVIEVYGVMAFRVYLSIMLRECRMEVKTVICMTEDVTVCASKRCVEIYGIISLIYRVELMYKSDRLVFLIDTDESITDSRIKRVPQGVINKLLMRPKYLTTDELCYMLTDD